MFASHRITRPGLACFAMLITACTKKDNAAVDTTAVASTTSSSIGAQAATPISLADIAGKWNMRSVPTSGSDTTATTYVLTATNNPSGWTITFPGRKPQPVQISAEGDSIVIGSPTPYASVRRKGAQVTTLGVLRLQNGDLIGSTTAHYNVKTADSVLILNVTGTRTK